MSLVEYTEPVWRGLNMRALRVDQAYLVVKAVLEGNLYLYILSDDCYKCSYKKLAEIPSFAQQENVTLKLDVARPMRMQLRANVLDQENLTFCECYLTDLREFGVYNFTYNANGTCTLETDKEGVNIYLSFCTALFLLLAVISTFKLIKWFWSTSEFAQQFHRKLYLSRERSVDELAVAAPQTATPPHTESCSTLAAPVQENQPNVPIQTVFQMLPMRRVRCLDAFRGMAIVLMIFVNSGGGNYWWIEHATWNGLHLADVVFPFFLWIMGVCIPISVKSLLSLNVSRSIICRRILVRSIKLFLIGLMLNSINGPQMADLRIMGVLQRFGIAYLVCSVIHVYSIRTDWILPQGSRAKFTDLFLFKNELVCMLLLIATHLGIIFGLPVPDCPTGYLGPGGLHAKRLYQHCTGGATGFIDTLILGRRHLYQHSTANHVYGGEPFDPEGLFGCLLTIVQVFFGMLAGITLLVYHDWRQRVLRWMCWSVLLGLLGGVLCLFSTEGGVIPVNKNLWSLSFVCVTTSLAFFMLTILFLIMDVWRKWDGSPFVESGKNAIIMYVGHTIMHKMLPWHWRIGEMNTHFVLMLESMWNTAIWVLIALYLNAKHIYYSL